MNGISGSAVARVVVAAMTACLLAVGASTAVAGAPGADTVLVEESAEAGAWGDTMKWEDGLAVTVFPPETFAPSSTAAGHAAGHQGVKWRIKVTNETDEAFHGALMSVYVKSGDDGESCERIHDGKISDGIAGSVSPGSSGTAEFGFDVPREQLGKVDLEVRPGFSREGLHWVGEVSSS